MTKNSLSALLVHRVVFLENKTKSELEEQNWVPILEAFAEVKPMYDNKFGSIENFNFGHIVTEAFFMFKIRFTDKVNPKMRISFGARIFEIKRIINVAEKDKILQIIALEI